MLHLPLEHPRGLMQKTPRISGSGDNKLMLVTYAYPFPGSHRLTVPPAGYRPRELLPLELYNKLRAEGVLQFRKDYEKIHGEGVALHKRPTFGLKHEVV